MFETYRSLKTSPNYTSGWSRNYIFVLSATFLGAATGLFSYACTLSTPSEGSGLVVVVNNNTAPFFLIMVMKVTAVLFALLAITGIIAAVSRNRIVTVLFGYLSLQNTIALFAAVIFILAAVPAPSDTLGPEEGSTLIGRMWQRGVSSGNPDVCAVQTSLDCSGLMICCNHVNYTSMISSRSSVSDDDDDQAAVLSPHPDCQLEPFNSMTTESSTGTSLRSEQQYTGGKGGDDEDVLVLSNVTNQTCSTMCGVSNQNKEACASRIRKVFPRMTMAAVSGALGVLTLTGGLAALRLRAVDTENPYTIDQSD